MAVPQPAGDGVAPPAPFPHRAVACAAGATGNAADRPDRFLEADCCDAGARPAESSAEALGRPVTSAGEERSCRDPARLRRAGAASRIPRAEEHTSELQSPTR